MLDIAPYLNGHSFSKGDVSRHSQVIQLEQIWNIRESAEELFDLGKVIVAKFDEGGGFKHPLRAHHKGTVFQAVKVAHHQK